MRCFRNKAFLAKIIYPPPSFSFPFPQCSLIPIPGASASGKTFIISPSSTVDFFPPLLLSHFILPKGSVLPFISWHFTSADGNDTNGMWLRLYYRNAVRPAQVNLQIIPQERNKPWRQVQELQVKKKTLPLPGWHSCHCPSFLPKSCASKITVKDGGCCSGSFGVASVSKHRAFKPKGCLTKYGCANPSWQGWFFLLFLNMKTHLWHTEISRWSSPFFS